MVVVTDKSLLSVNGFPANSEKSVSLTVIILRHMSTRMVNLCNYIIWLTQYLIMIFMSKQSNRPFFYVET